MTTPIIFLDNNSTTRVLSEVLEAMLPYWTDRYFNSSSTVGEMTGCDTPIYDVKRVLCEVLNAADPSEFTLTSGATEANNWVFHSVATANRRNQCNAHIIASSIEHPSVLEAAIAAKCDRTLELSLAPVNRDGVIDIEALLALIRPDTHLVSVMLANNETGVIQPVGELARRIKDKHPLCLVHTDATQAVGKISIDLLRELDAVDFLSLSAHKFHGPKGIGALFIRSGRAITPLIHGGGQQEGLRSGTDNSPLAAGMAAALRIIAIDMDEQNSRIASLRNELDRELKRMIPKIKILGQQVPRLQNTTFAIFPDHEGEVLVHLLAEQGFAVSSGSACSQGGDRPSHVVTAMGIEYTKARNTLRVSLSRYTTRQDMYTFISVLAQSINTGEQNHFVKGQTPSHL